MFTNLINTECGNISDGTSKNILDKQLTPRIQESIYFNLKVRLKTEIINGIYLAGSH